MKASQNISNTGDLDTICYLLNSKEYIQDEYIKVMTFRLNKENESFKTIQGFIEYS